MDYKLLDSIVDSFIRENEFHVSTLSQVLPMCEEVLKEKNENIDNYNWSKKIDINESVQIVYDFLNEIDENLSNQFINIINQVDKNNNPIVNILPKKDYPNGEDRVEDGKVYIYYDNSPNDIFIVLHEMLHKMNECNIINENNQISETFTRDYFGEAVSITGEMMLGDYLIQNNIISENDFNLRKQKRLNGSRENARDVIIESELIKLKLSGQEINEENLKSIIDNYDKEKIEYEVLIDEFHDVRRITSILQKKSMNLKKSQRYVIAQYLSEELMKSDSLTEDFILLNEAVGDSNSDINEVVDNIKNKYPSL